MSAFRSVLRAAAGAFVAALPLHAQDPVKPPSPAPLPAAKDAAPPKAPVALPKLELGQKLPAWFELADLDGKAHKADDLKDKVVVLNFYSIECPIQRAWDGRLAELQQQFAGKGVVFLHIDSNHTEIGDAPPAPKDGDKPYDAVRRHLAEAKLPFTVLVDHGNLVADAFGGRCTPHVFVFQKDGTLVYRGLVDDDQRNRKGDKAQHHLRDTLTSLTDGKAVDPWETTPEGCSIKRVSRRPPRAEPARDGTGKEVPAKEPVKK